MIINRNGGRPEDANVFVTTICSVGALLCMVVAVLGIKFKWFKHRLNFQNVPGGSESSEVAQKGAATPLQGVFRTRPDADIFVEVDRPRSLPPVRIRKSELHLPLPHQKQVSSNGPEAPLAPIPPPLPTSSPPYEQEFSQSRHANRPKSEPSTGKSHQNKSTSSRRKKKTDPNNAPPQYSEVQKADQAERKEHKRNKVSPEQRQHRPKSHTNNHTDKTRHFEKLKDDKPPSKDNIRLAERRPTGYIRPPEEDMKNLTETDTSNSKVVMKLDGFSDDEEETQQIFEKVKAKVPVPEPRNTTAPRSPVEPKKSDAWSAVARHRILTEELTKQHSALKPVTMDSKANGTDFHNPIAERPRTMRDMKKNQQAASGGRVVIGSEHDDTEA